MSARGREENKSEPVLLSGGNPQIAKADGDAPVQAFIAAMPGWKQQTGHDLDRIIKAAVPQVCQAVRWNNPFYGIEGKGWFLAFRCFTKYVKVSFLNGAYLQPLPPVASKDPNTRYFHIHEDDVIDEQLLTDWVRQASALPGVQLFQLGSTD